MITSAEVALPDILRHLEGEGAHPVGELEEDSSRPPPDNLGDDPLKLELIHATRRVIVTLK